jgi:hypothetical protein
MLIDPEKNTIVQKNAMTKLGYCLGNILMIKILYVENVLKSALTREGMSVS